MATQAEDTVKRLRDLNGVLELAVLLAVDVIAEHDSHGMSKADWQERLLKEASKKLTTAGRFPGRFSLFTDEEIRSLAGAEIPPTLLQEIEWEIARRGVYLQ